MSGDQPNTQPTAPSAAPSLLLPVVAALGVAMMLIASTARRVAVRGKRVDTPSPGAPVLHAVPNVGVEDLTPGTIAWLKLYAVAAERRGIAVTVTSGKRDVYRQAAAMIDKLERGEDLHALYRDDKQIDELLSGPATVDRWASVIARYAANGRAISNHLSGTAADIRSRDWTPQQLQEAAALAVSMGAKRAIVESNHLHIEVGK